MGYAMEWPAFTVTRASLKGCGIASIGLPTGAEFSVPQANETSAKLKLSAKRCSRPRMRPPRAILPRTGLQRSSMRPSDGLRHAEVSPIKTQVAITVKWPSNTDRPSFSIIPIASRTTAQAGMEFEKGMGNGNINPKLAMTMPGRLIAALFVQRVENPTVAEQSSRVCEPF
jgi:hypothetical protein